MTTVEQSSKRLRLWFNPDKDQELIGFLDTMKKGRRRSGKLIHMIRLGLKENPDLLGPEFMQERDMGADIYEVRIRISPKNLKDLNERWHVTPWGDRSTIFTQLARIGFRRLKDGAPLAISQPAAANQSVGGVTQQKPGGDLGGALARFQASKKGGGGLGG